ncbi:MAG: UDP-N-acetylmuramate:L-alanyl-gamma-D-glutamyl-meso-diaminopimelate ligase [Deltaproteobacteria bacterium]|nr:UDP-N-acetylmuramate:L-alanyl-gamma-D-glutamyl-meso-diaminopimelate ligase [Deltaproteobacteria bacterium]
MNRIHLEPPASIHLIGICGTGMGALAGLLQAKGFTVSGSDAHAYPPMSTDLERRGVRVIEGYRAGNLDHNPDLVVVGNVCRVDHPEAAAAVKRGLAYASFPRTVRDIFLDDRDPIVIAGTHGKTTTTALTAFLLHATGRDPSFLIGGISADFGAGFGLGQGPSFVIEGDEYDSAYFEKQPKFLSYAPAAAVITSIEHDHIDIYPTAASYHAAFDDLAELVDPGPLAVYAGDPDAIRATESAHCEVATYGVEGDAPAGETKWLASIGRAGEFELRIEGRRAGLFRSPMEGRHNLRNTLAALIMAHEAAGAPLAELGQALPNFLGVARRQQVLGRPGDITVYDDFAHHPTAVRETISALAALHPAGRLLAAFEPRSATACRRLHQQAYVQAFDGAGLAIIAPVGRELPAKERLDTERLVAELERRGVPAVASSTHENVLAKIVQWTRPGDGVVLMSNGAFGGIRDRLLEALK